MAKNCNTWRNYVKTITPGVSRFVQSESFDVVYGGGEANVAVSVANYGHECIFCN